MTGSFICIIVDQSCFLLQELFLRKIGEIIEVVIPGFFSFCKFFIDFSYFFFAGFESFLPFLKLFRISETEFLHLKILYKKENYYDKL